MNGCVFCDIAADPTRSQTAVSTLDGERTVVSFEPLNPVTPGHRLFVPVQHYAFAHEMPSCLLGDVFRAAADWADARGGYNLIQSNGRHATQTIFHVHVHLVPRTRRDGLHLPWTGQHGG